MQAPRPFSRRPGGGGGGRSRKPWRGPSLLAALALLAVLAHSGSGPGRAWGSRSHAAPAPKSLAALESALERLQPLSERVEAGEVLPDFGEQAQAIWESAVGTGAEASEAAEASVQGRALDSALRALFERQAAQLAARAAASVTRQAAAAQLGPGAAAAAAAAPVAGAAATALPSGGGGGSGGGSAGTAAAAAAASGSRPVGGARLVEALERSYLAEAQALVRPGSAWDLQPHRQALREALRDNLRREAALSEERARAAREQRAAMGVVARLQEQAEQLQQKAQGVRGGGSPWVLSTSYRVPNTPFQLAGKYEQGRANLELSLTPERSPTDSDGGFMNGIGPANVGVSFNLGL